MPAMPQTNMPRNSAPQPYMNPQDHQAMQYQAYLQQQQATGAYPMPPQAGMHQQR
jgi:pheromone receptor transcription factor